MEIENWKELGMKATNITDTFPWRQKQDFVKENIDNKKLNYDIA